MELTRLDMAHYPRRAHFDYFRTMSNPWIGVTVPVDATELMRYVRASGAPLFLTTLYAVARAANAVPELRRRIDGDGIVEFAHCSTSHTEGKADGTYAYCTLDDAGLSLAEYIAVGREQQRLARESGSIEEEDPRSMLFISSLPWLSYTALVQPTTSDPRDSNPRITWGKVEEENGRFRLPMTILVHHALADGAHIAAFYENLSREFEQICGKNKTKTPEN